MTTAQKIIKYLAIALAFAIIVGVITAIYRIGETVLVSEKILDTPAISEYRENDIDNLKIEIAFSKLNIKKGDFKVETNNEKVTTEIKNKTLIVRDKSKRISLFGMSKKSKSYTTIYLPDDFDLKNVSLKTGAGEVKIENLIANDIKMEIGAGSTVIDNIIAEGKMSLDGGVGELTIKKGVINNLTTNLGIGKTSFTGVLYGKNKIECGIGEVKFDLLDEIDEYTIKTKQGIGSILVNKKRAYDNTVIGNGSKEIVVSGGIGDININTKQ